MAKVTPADPDMRRPGPPGEPGLAQNEQTRSAAHRLGKCPVCSYSLRGLPGIYRCPECGFHYDSQTRIWRPLKAKAIFGRLIGFIFGIEVLVWFVLAAPIYSIAMFVLWMGLVSYVGWRCCLVYKHGQFACLGPDGIRYRLREAEAQLILWKDIAAIHRQRFDKLCRIEPIEDQKNIFLQGVFYSPADVVEFADLANQRLTAHRKASAPEPSPA